MDKQIDHDALFEVIAGTLRHRAMKLHVTRTHGKPYAACEHPPCAARKTHDFSATVQLSGLGAQIDTDRAELDNLRELKRSQDQMIHELAGTVDEYGATHGEQDIHFLRQRQRTRDAYTLLVAEEDKSEALRKRLAEQHAELMRLRASLDSVIAIDGELVAALQKGRADLTAERETHERTRKAHAEMLGRRIDALTAERRDAYRLAERVRNFSPLWHNKLDHDETFETCKWTSCSNDRRLLAAHDARRDKGAK